MQSPQKTNNVSEIDNRWLSSCKFDIASQNGEDGIIEKIFEIMKEDNKWCVEFGAYDGEYLSNVWNLITNKRWSGVLIEADSKKYGNLVKTYRNNHNVICLNRFVEFEGLNTIDKILAETAIPKSFDLLCIDVDGNDYHIWESMKIYEPRAVIIEFNPSMSADIEFIQKKDMKINHGSSLLSLVKLGKQKGYELIATTVINAIFVKRAYFELFKIKDNSPSLLYQDRQFETRLLQMHDGSIVLSGCNRLIWHNMKMDEKSVQALPKWFTGFPPGLKFGLYLLLTGRWRQFFTIFKHKTLPRRCGAYLLCKRNLWFRNLVLKWWELKGRPTPPPHAYKQAVIEEYQKKFGYNLLVETGTYYGAMVDAQKKNFNKIISIELSKELFEIAKKRFKKYDNIKLYNGDSGEVLRTISLNEPAIFFLDGHYSGGATARGDKECPIFKEINAIFQISKLNHIIIIDDARCFIGQGDYPSIEELTNYIKKKDARYEIEVKCDIIRVMVKQSE